ncbi:MAG: DNA translocase FtsK 4TM domain-containing protein [Chloroflexia bacterium]
MGAAPTRKGTQAAAVSAGRSRGGATRTTGATKGTSGPKPRKAAATKIARPTAIAPAPPPRRRWVWPTLRLSERLRRDIIAVGLIVLTALTIWSLLGERGGLLGLWNLGLRKLFGWGAAFVPFALVAWVIDSFRVQVDEDGTPTIGLHRRHFIGTGLLFATVLGILHLPATDPLATGQAGEGGGLLGYLISAPLVAALRPVGAAIVLVGAAIVGTVILLNTDLRTIWRELVISVVGRRREYRPELDDEIFLPEDEPTAARLRVVRTEEVITSVAPQEPEQPEEGLVINLPTPPERRPAPQVEAVGRGSRPRPALDAPTEPLVVGTGQLPLPEAKVAAKVATKAAPPPLQYQFPPLINLPLYDSVMPNGQELAQKAKRIEETLTAFKVDARVREINPGAAVTQFALEPGPGVKVRAIKILENDLALALAATSINIETPIPGQPRVGIVIPNKNIATVGLRETMESKEFTTSKAKLPFALGRDVNGKYIVPDMAKMPHLLIAGSTGSGKSVCLNAIISTFLLTRSPDELKLVMIDPKMVELVGYNGIPHLKSPVIIEMDKVVGTLRKALTEMERRYQLFSQLGVRNMDGYRARRETDPSMEHLPYLVIIIDELADLMMTTPDEVESVIVRLAQMARATGIHLIIATQRPSVDVLTGLIKANFPARIAFMVTSQIDSRVILDMPGAERLLGKGDMLFQAPDAAKPVRVQGTWVDDRDIERMVGHWRHEVPTSQYDPEWVNVPSYRPGESEDDADDPMLEKALAIVEEHGTVSISMLQRRLRIGFNKAARLVEQMEEEGIIGPSEGVRGRPALSKRPKSDPFDGPPPWDDE